ncbi:hypothetical protein NIES4101_53650 [Calothrix sp. NIES-4101]|nr:hypothetical protein NIES4101_53650 [Calothrix sp. NIES-4101]
MTEKRFHPNFAYITCGNGCNTKLQALLYDAEGNPSDVDWTTLQQIYNEHNANCSVENPWTEDPNGFYGNPNDCYQNEGWYCTF